MPWRVYWEEINVWVGGTKRREEAETKKSLQNAVLYEEGVCEFSAEELFREVR